MSQVFYSNIQVTKVLLLRGNTIQNDRYVGLPGEPTIDTELYELRVHDGSTPGGHIVSGGGTNYGNANVAVYLPTYGGNILVNQVNLANDQGVFSFSPTAIAIGANIPNIGLSSGVIADGAGETWVFANTNVRIYSNNAVGDYTWSFNQDSTTTLPGGTIYAGYPGAGYSAGSITMAGDQAWVANTSGANYVGVDNLSAEIGVGTQNWRFDTAGNITFPDTTVQTTAFSNIALANYLAGTVTIGNLTVQGNITTVNSEIVQHNEIVAGNITSNNFVTAQYFQGNGSLLTGLPVGYSNVQVAGYLGANYYITSNTANLSLYAWSANITAANVGMKGYVDAVTTAWTANANIQQALIGNLQASAYSNVNVAAYLSTNNYLTSTTANLANYAWSANVTAANVGVVGYINQQVTAANTAANQANIGMLGYVNSQSFYSNTKVASYLQYGNISNISVAGNVTAGYFIGNGALLTGIAASSNYSNIQVATYLPTYTGNIANVRLGPAGVLTFADGTTMTTAATGGGGNYSNVNVNAWFSANIAPSLYSNVNVAVYLTTATITTTGNITAGNLTSTNGLYVANITTTGSSGNISGANYITANVILTNGGWGNISQVANIQANAVLVSGNVTAGYFLGNGALLTGIVASGSTYGNTQVAQYLPTYTGNIANVRLGVAGVLTFADSTTQTTAAVNNNFGNVNVAAYTQTMGYTNYSNVNVTSYLGTGQVTISNIKLGVSGNIVFSDGTTMTTAATGSGSSYSNVNAQSLITSLGLTNYSNVNTAAYLSTATINTTGNITAQNISGNISITGNVTGTQSNVTLQAGSYISVFDNQGNVTVPKLFTAGNIQTSGYLFGNGAFLTGIVTGGGSYGNTQVAQYLPTYTGAVQTSNLTVISGGDVFADFSNANVNARTLFVTTAANATTGIYAVPSGTATAASWQAANSANLTATSKILIATNGTTDVQLVSGINGTGTYLPLSFYNNGSAQMQLTVSGNLNMTVNNSITANGTGYFIGNSVGTSATYTGNVTVGNLTVSGNLSANLLSITANSITGTGTNTSITAGSYTSTFDNSGNVLLPNVVVTSNISAGFNGRIYAGNVYATNFIGNSVGTTATYTGNVTAGGIVATQYGNSYGTTASYTGNITAGGSSGPQTRFLWDTWQANTTSALTAFTPSGTIGGNAAWDSTQAYGLKLTPSSTTQNGYINWNSSSVNYNYDMVITASIGAGNGTGADGQWIYFGANAVPQSNPGANASNGGIAVFNHYYSGANQFEVYVAGTQTNIPYIGNGNYITSGVILWNASYNSFYNLTLKIRKIQNGNRMMEVYLNEAYQGAVNIGSWTPAGNYFGVAAYTGGSTANNWVRQLRIDW